jgi:hypothetical protein
MKTRKLGRNGPTVSALGRDVGVCRFPAVATMMNRSLLSIVPWNWESNLIPPTPAGHR